MQASDIITLTRNLLNDNVNYQTSSPGIESAQSFDATMYLGAVNWACKQYAIKTWATYTEDPVVAGTNSFLDVPTSNLDIVRVASYTLPATNFRRSLQFAKTGEAADLYGCAFDGAGNCHVAALLSGIYQFTPSGVKTLHASPVGVRPRCLAVDSSGNEYVGDANANWIWKVDTNGNWTVYGDPLDTSIQAIAIDASGNIYASTTYALTRIAPDLTATTLQYYIAGDGGYRGMIYDDNHQYILFSQWASVWRWSASGGIELVAGDGLHSVNRGYVNGPALTARFAGPTGLALDNAGNLYIGDDLNFAIRKLDTSNNVTTYYFTGDTPDFPVWWNGSLYYVGATWGLVYRVESILNNGECFIPDYTGQQITRVHSDGSESVAATLTDVPSDLCFDALGNVYCNLIGNGKVKKITSSGTVTDYMNIDDGRAAQGGYGILQYTDGNFYLSTTDNNHGYLLKVVPTGTVPTPSGDITEVYQSTDQQYFYGVEAGPDGWIYFIEGYAVSRYRPGDGYELFAGSITVSGNVDAQGGNARFGAPYDLTVDDSNNVYLADFTYGLKKIDTSANVTLLIANDTGSIPNRLHGFQPASIAYWDGSLYIGNNHWDNGEIVRVDVTAPTIWNIWFPYAMPGDPLANDWKPPYALRLRTAP